MDIKEKLVRFETAWDVNDVYTHLEALEKKLAVCVEVMEYTEKYIERYSEFNEEIFQRTQKALAELKSNEKEK